MNLPQNTVEKVLLCLFTPKSPPAGGTYYFTDVYKAPLGGWLGGKPQLFQRLTIPNPPPSFVFKRRGPGGWVLAL